MVNKARFARQIAGVILTCCLMSMTVRCYNLGGPTTQPKKRYCTIYIPCDPIPDQAYVTEKGVEWNQSQQALKCWVPTEYLIYECANMGTITLSKQGYVTDSVYLGAIFFDHAATERISPSEWEIYDWGTSSWCSLSTVRNPSALWKEDNEGCLVRRYRRTSTLTLKRDLPVLHLTFNSEPAGARVYQAGRLMGTAPVELSYELDDPVFRRGYMQGESLVVIADGYLPEFVEVRREMTSINRHGHETVDEYRLVVLKRDPHAPTQILEQPPYAQPSSRLYDSDRASEYEAAKAEYDQALIDWEAARRDYDNAVYGSNMISENASQNKVLQVLDKLSPLARDEAARKLAVAQDRLNQAKSRLQALDWR